MSDLDINDHLIKEDLFALFKRQLKKDFESSGLDAAFTNTLPAQFVEIRRALVNQLDPLITSNSTLIGSMLYRVDISEAQLNAYRDKNSSISFAEILAELIIKRILQKVILRKTFSKK